MGVVRIKATSEEPPMKVKKKPGKTTTPTRKKVFSDEERSAMVARYRESKGEGVGEAEVLAKIAEFQEADQALAKRVHVVIRATAPELQPKLWYGMPAYAKDGALICHFQPAQKFKTRYATLGFSDKAKLDDGDMWPVAYALPKMTPAAEAKIGALVRKAAG
jgi:uncharacterized protein YdhG (YjbR/CyaY superfamily)